MTLSLLHPALAELATPALVIHGAALRRNIEAMAETARRSGIALRPHAKTHKSSAIAWLQMQAGALGIACATVAEAEQMAAAGLAGLMLTAPVADPAKMARIARLNREADLMVAVDHVVQVDRLIAALQPGDRRLRVIIDTDIGQARTGITDIAAGLRLAQRIAQAPQLELVGVQGFAGHVQHIADPAQRRSAAAASSAALAAFTDALTAAGLRPDVVSGSGTGAYLYECEGP